MKRRGEAATALVIAILVALGIGAGYYVWKSQQGTSGNMNSSEDSRQKQEIAKVEALAHEIASELTNTFGKYYPNSLESFDLVRNVSMKWGDKKVSRVGDKAAYILPEEFVQKFSSMAKRDSLEIASDGRRFSIDINNGESFDREAILTALLHGVDELNAGIPTNYIDVNTVNGKIEESVTAKSVDAFGYVRFIFKTDIEDVYIIAVFSIDPSEGNHFKGRYAATGGKNILIAKSPDDFINRINDEMSFDTDFGILLFSLNASEHVNEHSTVDECLEKFIAQFEE